ncbi:glutaminase A [Kribbella solani]|uniref:Glutaminase n=1 Tax=Kribbella solani TaxID=236067 RepID=A0A841DE91_9ACTN|nr:glutaminase A [Kribbella solani]MBB5976822.1 glutaminase [Kribbella solani]
MTELAELAETRLRLFAELDKDGDGRVWLWDLLARLGQAGILPEDPRVLAALEGVRDSSGRPAMAPGARPVQIDVHAFAGIAQYGDRIVERALSGELAVPADEFREFARGVEAAYDELLANADGHVADYIPTLRDADPDKFGIAICTADGQLFSIGDAKAGFSVQSTSKPFNYAMALEEFGAEEVHRWVGQEQSGGTFNDPRLSLDHDGKPQNPMINAGAMATLALVEPGLSEDGRQVAIDHTWTRMMGAEPGHDHATFLAERDTGHGNRGLAGLMAAKGMLRVDPRDRDAPQKAAEFYFGVCSMQVDAERLAAAGATLASGGIAPYSGERVFGQETVGRVLSVMGHSGMYNDSGRFSEQVGLPAKSGVSGNVMMVVPSKQLAVVVFSPRLDEAGNSVRGVEVCRRLVNEFGLHPYKGLGADRGRVAGAVSRPAVGLGPADRKAETAGAMQHALDGVSGPVASGPATSTTATQSTTPSTERTTSRPGHQL